MRNISELLKNALVLVPIAILVFVRVFAKVLVDKKKRQRVESNARPSSKTPVRKAFDRLSKFMTGSQDPSTALREPLDFELSEKRRFERPESTPKAVATPAPRQAVMRPSMPAGVGRASSNAQRSGASPTGLAAPSPFPQTVKRLSPLKQAFVFSAILGKPRSFDY